MNARSPLGEQVGEATAWIRTFTGRKFWPLDPRPDDVDILDIAHALAHTCRYTGHCRTFYSVAQHSVLVSRHVPKEFALWGLLHDAAEAYLADVARPVKKDIPGLKQIEARLMRAITLRFNLPPNEPDEVKAVDTRILVDEMRVLMPCPDDAAHFGKPLGVYILPLQPGRAEALFLQLFSDLTEDL